MTAKRKADLLEALDREVAIKEVSVRNAEESKRERVEQTIGSWSAGGDRAHAENSLEMAKVSLARLNNLKEKIHAENDFPSEKISPVCFVKLTSREFYLADESLNLPGVLILGTGSPLGKEVFGKKVGEEFVFMDKPEKVESIE